ncbi:MAG: formate dehydrogenase accessory sulfurtransferase FdhD [Actinomycetota bacterium]|nr:formate dehydrogenase accessory sulfurtransferase FdhD [Actinomycetota bacterium]MDQ6946223.1 formate dehydrogenase accessory sulfurtransferase FdhD [Actinomycetota bacterium]
MTYVHAVGYRRDHSLRVPESVATEEPLEIRVAGPGQVAQPAVVTMRTPGHDFELAAGFLITEGLTVGADVAAVAYCDAAKPENRCNTVTVSLRRAWDPTSTKRDFVATSACGVCGKSSIAAVELTCPTVPPGPPIAASLIPSLPDRLRAGQRVFDSTGGLHAAGLFDGGGQRLCVREDVGRHNAVDKVVGNRLLSLPGSPRIEGSVLMVSGRVSFEIVQKAAMAGIAILAAVSAPSSLAVAAADRLGLTVAGFVRDGRYNIYSHPERIDLDR